MSADADSFKKLRAEVCLGRKYDDDIWVVPALTEDKARLELTIEHFELIERVLASFEGSSLISFSKPPKPPAPDPSERPRRRRR